MYKCQAELCLLGDDSPSFEWRKWEAGELANPSTFKRYEGPGGEQWGGLHYCSKCVKFLCRLCGGEFPIVCDQCKGQSSIPGSEDSKDEVPLDSVQGPIQAELIFEDVEHNFNCKECSAFGQDTNGDALLPCKCCELVACR